MNTFFDRMASLYQRVTSIEVDLGMPQRRNLLIRHSDSKTKSIEDYLINPRPYITSVPTKLIGMNFGEIVVSQTDFLVEIPRVSSEQLFVRNKKIEEAIATPSNNSAYYVFDLITQRDSKRVTFIIDPPVTDDLQIIYSNSAIKKLDSGIKCHLIHIYDDDPIIWKLILQKEKD